jgi:hypothetical protein
VVEALGAAPWLSERILRRKGFEGHVPDALFRLGKKQCALELELVQKRRERYLHMFRLTREAHPDLDIVWYLCASPGIAQAVLGESRAAGDAGRYFVSPWEEFCAAGGETVLAGARGQFRLKELV